MTSSDDYDRQVLEQAKIAISKGHHDPNNLRNLLIWTTARPTAPMIREYFHRHLEDRQLLRELIAIALEGEDHGDAPWAAANVITEFPGKLLREIEPELHRLSNEEWDYLNAPAKMALSKIRDATRES